MSDYASIYRDTLLNDVMPFWLKHGMDHEHGGIMTCLVRDGSIIDTDKSVWFQGYMTSGRARCTKTVLFAAHVMVLLS